MTLQQNEDIGLAPLPPAFQVIFLVRNIYTMMLLRVLSERVACSYTKLRRRLDIMQDPVGLFALTTCADTTTNRAAAADLSRTM